MKYKANILGYKCTLVLGECPKIDEDYALSLLFCHDGDFLVRDVGRRRVGDDLRELVLSWFFGSLRGYPEMQLEFFTGGGNFSIDVFPETYGRVKVKLPDCKLICTKLTTLSDGIMLDTVTVGTGRYRIRLTECACALRFDAERLPSLRFISGNPDCDAAFAVETDGSDALCRVSKDAPPGALLALLSYLSSRGAERARVNESYVEILRGGFAMLPVTFFCLS